MIWALVILALGGNATAALSLVLAHQERKALISAMLQSTGNPDAARRLTHEQAKKDVDMQLELQQSGGVFTATNPFGNRKPEGV